MSEAAADGPSLWPIIILAVYWAYILVWDEHGKQKWLDTLFSSGLHPPDGATAELSAPDSQAMATVAPKDIDENSFMIGANKAYEFILKSYAAGNVAELVEFVAPDVLEAFSESIEDRAARGERLSLDFVTLRDSRIVTKDLRQTQAEITVRFDADIFVSNRRGESERSADESWQLLNAIDVWTFRNERNAGTTNWILVATDTE